MGKYRLALHSLQLRGGDEVSVRLSETCEAVVLQGTLTLMSLWLALTLALRFAPLRGKWLRARFIVSQCDLLFHSHHWVDPQKVLAKRRTELGGAFTIAVSRCCAPRSKFMRSSNEARSSAVAVVAVDAGAASGSMSIRTLAATSAGSSTSSMTGVSPITSPIIHTEFY